MIKGFCLFYFLFSLTTVFSQQNIEYFGLIKLSDTAMISYKLNFNESDGNIKGFSVTDLGGAHETKSVISGVYDEKSGVIKFQERDIIYTKSPIVQEDFCFVNFEGKLKRLNESSKLEGNFRGLYKNGDKCIDGTISMMGMSSLMKRAEKLDSKIDRSKKVDQETKDKISVTKAMDTLNKGVLNKNENLQIFSKYKKVKLVLYDGGKVDGDRINLFINGKLVLDDYLLTQEKKVFEIDMAKPLTEVEVLALNVGSSKPNTVTLEIMDEENFTRTSTNLSEGEKTKVSITKSR